MSINHSLKMHRPTTMKQHYHVNKLSAIIVYIFLQGVASNQENLAVQPEESLQSFREDADHLLSSVNKNLNQDSNHIDLLNSFDSSIHYRIDWKERPNDFVVNEGNQSILTLTGADLNNYHCILPRIEPEEQSTKEIENIDPYSKIEGLFEKKICIYKLDSYWTYEICLNDYIRQFNGDILEKKHTQEYFLGMFKSKNLEKDRQEYNKQISKLKANNKELPKIDYDGVKVPYIYLTMDKGTICDLNNKPRKTTVYYVCDKNEKPQLESIEEIQSCEYSAIISTNLLCDHPDFKEKKEDELQIDCFPNSNIGQPIKPVGIEQYDTKPLNLLSETILDQIQEMVSASNFKNEFEALDKANSEIRAFETSRFATELIDNRELSTTAFLEAKRCYVSTYKTYWSYSFCFKKAIKMFHEENGQRTKEILLGRFDENKHLNWLKANPSKYRSSTEVNYLFSDGDICHETNRLRYVEVKLKCPNVDTKQFYMKLEEPKLCEYKLTIESGPMCQVLKMVNENGL